MINNEEGFEETVILSLANKFIQEKSMWWTDIKRTDGAVMHGFFIIWPITLNEQGDEGKIYISNVDPNEVNVYNVTVRNYPKNGSMPTLPSDATFVEIQSPENSLFYAVYGPKFLYNKTAPWRIRLSADSCVSGHQPCSGICKK